MLHQINKQEPLPLDRDESGTVRVHSYFRTIQGEGPFAGQFALFIRLAGCNLQCPGCDTEYTSRRHKYEPELLATLARIHAPSGGLIVITGGEPFRQNINRLVDILVEHGFRVQIESNGVLYPGDDFPWDHPQVTVVISPKTGRINPKTAERASAYKYVLSHDDVAPDGLPVHALGHPLGKFPHVARPPLGWEGPVYLNPMDAKDSAENAANVQAVVRSVMTHRTYIMGVQMHKLTGLP